jgi:hypothetical protein
MDFFYYNLFRTALALNDAKNSYKREGQLVFLVLMARLEKKSMSSPDETRTFDKGKIELTRIGDASIGRIYLEPGWSHVMKSQIQDE